MRDQTCMDEKEDPFKTSRSGSTLVQQAQSSAGHSPHTDRRHHPLHAHTSRDHAIAHVWHVQRVLPLFQAVLGARDALFDILDLAGGERLTLPRTLEGRHRLWQGRAQGVERLASLAAAR